MSERRMVAPGSKDAPRFKSTKPEELRRFIRLMEDLWQEAKVTDDQAQKAMIGKYADQESEEEWTAFDSFSDGYSWEEFKEELIENYPEAAAAERGTPSRIRQICSKAGKIEQGDMTALYAFRRSFMSEAKKLQKDPAIMANRELVDIFLRCLTTSFAEAVLSFLRNNPPSSTTSVGKIKDTQKTPQVMQRRKEDKYDLEDVCKAAILVSESTQGLYNYADQSEQRNVMLFHQPVSETKVLTDKLSELEGEQALEKDRLVGLGKTLETRMGGLEDMIKSLMKIGQANEGFCRGDCKGGNCKMHDASSNSMQRGGKSLDNEKCFWCDHFGHFQADCDDLKNQIRIGNVNVKWFCSNKAGPCESFFKIFLIPKTQSSFSN